METIVICFDRYQNNKYGIAKSLNDVIGKNKIFDVSRASADIETNLSFEQLRALFRHAWVKYPGNGNMVADTMTTEDRVKEWEREETESRKTPQ